MSCKEQSEEGQASQKVLMYAKNTRESTSGARTHAKSTNLQTELSQSHSIQALKHTRSPPEACNKFAPGIVIMQFLVHLTCLVKSIQPLTLACECVISCLAFERWRRMLHWVSSPTSPVIISKERIKAKSRLSRFCSSPYNCSNTLHVDMAKRVLAATVFLS